MSTPNLPMLLRRKRAWNKDRIVGQKQPLLPKRVWAIRVRPELCENLRDLALFDVAVDSKLRGCDLVSLKVADVYAVGRVKERTYILHSKTKLPVQFETTKYIRTSLSPWIETREDRGAARVSNYW